MSSFAVRLSPRGLTKLHEAYTEWEQEGKLLPGAFEYPPHENDVRTALFEIPPVEWNRLPHFQVRKCRPITHTR
jgi:hypothetical protein